VRITGSRIGPNVTLERGARVEDSELRDCIVGAEAVIRGARLHDSIIGAHSRIEGVRGRVNLGGHSEVEGVMDGAGNGDG